MKVGPGDRCGVSVHVKHRGPAVPLLEQYSLE